MKTLLVVESLRKDIAEQAGEKVTVEKSELGKVLKCIEDLYEIVKDWK